MRSDLRAWLVSPAVVVAACIAVALLAVLQFSFRAHVPGSLDVGGFTFDNFGGMGKSIYYSAFSNTLWLSVETTIASLLIAYPLAYALVRVKSRALKSFILVVSITPLFLGEIVRTYSWIAVLGSNGFINGTLRKLGLIEWPLELMFTHFGVLIALVHVTIPVVVLMLATAISHIDRDYEKAAQSLGAGPVKTFVTVTLPLSMPGIVAGFLLVFIPAVGEFVIPELLGGPGAQLIGRVLWTEFFQNRDWPLASALAIVLLAALVLPIALFQWRAER
jgi:putative spermidine/putrescine transport system permease protein